MIRYQENTPRKDNDGRPIFHGRTPYDRQNANAHWAEHYGWQIVLAATMNDRTLPAQERFDAACELSICERKLAHWQRHRNWNAAQAARDALRVKTVIRLSRLAGAAQ